MHDQDVVACKLITCAFSDGNHYVSVGIPPLCTQANSIPKPNLPQIPGSQTKLFTRFGPDPSSGREAEVDSGRYHRWAPR